VLEPTSKEASTKSYKRTKKSEKKTKAAAPANHVLPRGSAVPQLRGPEHRTAARTAEFAPRGGVFGCWRRGDVSGGGSKDHYAPAKRQKEAAAVLAPKGSLVILAEN